MTSKGNTMLKNSKLKFEKVFKVTIFGLWLNGSHPALPPGWRLRSFATISTCLICFFFLSNSILTHRIPNGDYDDMIRESIMAIMAFTVVFKYIIIVRNRHVVLNLFQYIENNWKSHNISVAESKINSKYMNKGLRIIRFWLLITFLSVTLFIFKALIATVYYHCKGEIRYVHIFDLVYPSFLENHKNSILGYIGISCLSIAFGSYVMITYIGFEPLLSIFLLHFCGQLEILGTRMKNIFTETNNSEEVLNNMKEINVELKNIYELVVHVQITFVAFFEFTMKATTFLIPFTVFQIVQALRRDVLNIEFLSLLSGVVLQFYIPCYYSNFLMEKSEYMRQAIYSCGWENHPNSRIRKVLIFMQTRTTRPVVLRTIFYPLSLDTFAEMCRQAYAIYSIMKVVWV